MGNRATVKYSTPSATNYWRYDDYNRVGTPDNPKWAFYTLTKSDSSWDKSAEAMHYLYDSQGRLEDSAFAQSPYSGYTPSGSNPYFDSSHPASSRARAFYTYDAAGRVLSIDHWWDTWGGSSYSSSYLVGDACAYETSGTYNRGLKTGDTFLTDSSGSPAAAWTQSYGYDANFDYLTSASYGDSQPNASQSWTYDAAGNRASDYTGTGWTYDNLNRMTASPSDTYTNDVLGNRTGVTPVASGSTAGSYTWDCLNRLTASHQPGTGGGTSTASMGYTYRADGMRVEKILHSGEFMSSIPGGPPGGEVDDVYTRYRYDGQMPMETFVTKADSSTVLTENGLGARALDYVSIANTPSGGSTTTLVVFPIYDAHGNAVATLSRSGSSYALNNQRSYGAWGEIRQGATTGGPRNRYCASLGHVQDDETSLVYMRSRYYEPTSGRFISQDMMLEGWNYFTYCGNQPIANADPDGRSWYTDLMAAYHIAQNIAASGATLAGLACFSVAAFMAAYGSSTASLMSAIRSSYLGLWCFVIADKNSNLPLWEKIAVAGVLRKFMIELTAALVNCYAGSKTEPLASSALSAITNYTMILVGLLAAQEVWDALN